MCHAQAGVWPRRTEKAWRASSREWYDGIGLLGQALWHLFGKMMQYKQRQVDSLRDWSWGKR
jgi:hypothetical protein